MRRHYRKTLVCRVPFCLPCATFRAHGKHTFCRVSTKKHTANTRHTANTTFTVCQSTKYTIKKETHGKKKVCRVPQIWTHGKKPLPCAQIWSTRQSLGKALCFAVCLDLAHGKPFFYFFVSFYFCSFCFLLLLFFQIDYHAL